MFDYQHHVNTESLYQETLSKTGTTYEINFTGVLATGKSVTGKYKGSLIYYDYSK